MQSAYPKYFKTPEGKPISILTMTKALKVIKRNPNFDYCGWNWFPTPGYHIITEFRKGMHKRINMRAMISTPEKQIGK